MFDWLTELLVHLVPAPAPWPTALALAAGVLVLGLATVGGAERLLARLAARTATGLDDLFLRRLRLPARALAVLLGAQALLALRGSPLVAVQEAVTVAELLLVAWLVIEAAETLFFHYWLGERKQVPVPAVVRHLVLTVVYTTVGLSILGSVTGLDLVPLLATSTVVTVVLGLALQETMGNLFAGLAMHAEPPFRLGEWVLVDGVEGQVVHLGWRSVHLRTLTRDVVVLPNAVVARSRVWNYAQPGRLTGRTVEVPVPLGAAPEAVERAARAALAAVPAVLTDPPPKVWLVGTTPLVQRYLLRFHVADFAHHDDAESDVLKAMWHALRAEGLELAVAPLGVDAAGEPVPLLPRGR